MIRVVIDYRDAAQSVESWPEAYKDRETALKFADIMEKIHSDVIRSLRVEVSCGSHGWHSEEESYCGRCGMSECPGDMAESIDGDARICVECYEQEEEDASNECGCGSSCSRCTGIPAYGPL